MANTPERVQQRKARHLIDFDAPREQRSRSEVEKAEHRLSTVQKWVLSTLAASTILHMSGGLVLSAYFMDRSTTEKLLMCVIAAAFGVIAVAVARAIHQVRIPSWWLVLGVIPGIIGVLLVV